MLKCKRSRLLPVLCLLLLTSPATAEGQQRDRFAGARAFIQETMEKNDLPSVAVAVAKDGRIIWEEGFGWADLDRRIPATGRTMYSLASISKPMTVTALMRLVEEGRVDLDRPANDYLGEGKIHSQVWDASGATVRRVMAHTAGLQWSGTVHTYEGTVPLTLRFQPDGDVHVRLGEELLTLLNHVSFREGRLIGRFAGTIPTEDTRRHQHSVLLDLRLRGDRFAGSATAYTTGEPAFFSLTSYVELKKKSEVE